MNMRRLPMTLRALVLVPLLAVMVDQARATLACGPNGQSCLEAAGQGFGAAGVVVLFLYALGLGLGVARLARGGPALAAPRPPLLRLWLIGSAGVAAVCGGQALLAGAMVDPGALGGGWPELLALCVAAGGAIALALRAAPALIRSLHPSAPRLRLLPVVAVRAPALPVWRTGAPLSPAAAGRAPPLT